MPASSRFLTRSIPIIDDSTPEHSLVEPDGQSRGLQLPRNRGAAPYAYGDAAEPFPQSLLIPESDWIPMIQEAERCRSTLRDVIDQAGLPCKDQGQTNYCWINAPVHCIEVVRVVQNQGKVILSPASAGARIKGFRNVGGWGKEGLEYLIENGCCPVEKWPANAINRSYDTSENREIAQLYRPVEWWELRPRSKAEQVSCLLRGIPFAAGYNWWSHEITNYQPIIKDGVVEFLIRNSWGAGWGDNGYGVLAGSRGLSDDSVAPRTVLAT